MQETIKILGNDCYKKIIDMGLKCTKPKAAWYLLVDFENYRNKLEEIGITSSQELTSALVEAIGFVTVPGEAFGLDPSTLAVRASYVDFDGDFAVNEGKGKTSENWAPQVHACLDALEVWLNSL